MTIDNNDFKMLGKTVSVIIEVETDPEELTLSKQDFGLTVAFTESAPEFDLFGYSIPVISCDERAATWSMKLPPIRFPELQKVEIAVYLDEEDLFEYLES